MLCKITSENHPVFIINVGDPEELQVFIGHHDEPFKEFVAGAISKVPCASKFLNFMDQAKDCDEFEVLAEQEPEPAECTLDDVSPASKKRVRIGVPNDIRYR